MANGFFDPSALSWGNSLGSFGNVDPNSIYQNTAYNSGSFWNGNNNSGNWFTNNGGFAGLGSLLSGIGQLGALGFGAYSGLQQSKLAKDQLKLARDSFNFEKGLANRNLANQAQTINNAYDASTQAAIGLMGGIDARTGQYIAPDDTSVAAIEARNKAGYVNGSPV